MTEEERDREIATALAYKAHFNPGNEQGQLILRDLKEKFGWDLPDYEDHHTILDVKPHERRGAKQPINHILLMAGVTINQKPSNTHESKGKVTVPENSGKEGRQEEDGSKKTD